MKSIFFFIVSMCLSFHLFAQDLDTLYNKKKQVFRIIHREDPVYMIQYKYFPDGTINTIDSTYIPENLVAGSLNNYNKKVWIFDKNDSKSLEINYFIVPKTLLSKEFYYNGNIIFTENYVNNKKDGKSKYFLSNGELYYSIYFLNGKKHGQAFGNQGSSIIYFNHDKLVKAIFYNNKKEIFSEQTFASDESKELIYYDRNEKEICRYRVKKGTICLNKKQRNKNKAMQELTFIENLSN